MVLILNCYDEANTITLNGRVHNTGDVIKHALRPDIKIGDLAQQFGGLQWPPRLVCRGCELVLSKTLDQQSCKTKDTIFLLNPLPTGACKQWARSGRCAQGSRCAQSKFHTKELSPRYIECLYRADALTGSTSDTSPPCSRSASPEQQISMAPRIICRNWASHGRCRHGDSCRYLYSHNTPNAPTGVPSDNVQRSGCPPPGWFQPAHAQQSESQQFSSEIREHHHFHTPIRSTKSPTDEYNRMPSGSDGIVWIDTAAKPSLVLGSESTRSIAPTGSPRSSDAPNRRSTSPEQWLNQKIPAEVMQLIPLFLPLAKASPLPQTTQTQFNNVAQMQQQAQMQQNSFDSRMCRVGLEVTEWPINNWGSAHMTQLEDLSYFQSTPAWGATYNQVGPVC